MVDLIALVGVTVVAVGLPVTFVAMHRSEFGPPRLSAARLTLGLGVQWVFALLVAGFVLVVEGRSLASVGVTFDPLSFGGGVVVAFAIAGGLHAARIALSQFRDVTVVDDVTVLLHAQSTRMKIAIAVTGGVTEEFLYRGYLIERTLELGAPPLVAGGLAAVAFLIAHTPGRDTRAVAASLAPVSVGFVIAYFLLRSVPPLAVAHTCINLLLLLSTDVEDVLEVVDRDEIDDRVLRAVDAD